MSTIYVPPESLLDSRTFKRLLAVSLVGHVALFLVLTLRPFHHTQLISPSPVMVNMVDMPKAAAPPAAKKPAAKPPPPKPPEAVPEPPKPKPVVNEVVIPKEPAPLVAKPKPAVKPEPKPKSAEEILAELTQKVEKLHPEPEPVAAAATGPAVPIAGGPGTFDPLLSPWVARVNSAVRSNWSGAQLCKGVPTFDIEVEANGTITDISLARSSGDRYCDESAERALRKSNPLPLPPYAMEVRLNLKLEGDR